MSFIITYLLFRKLRKKQYNLFKAILFCKTSQFFPSRFLGKLGGNSKIKKNTKTNQICAVK